MYYYRVPAVAIVDHEGVLLGNLSASDLRVDIDHRLEGAGTMLLQVGAKAEFEHMVPITFML